jgi:hypothetical protein
MLTPEVKIAAYDMRHVRRQRVKACRCVILAGELDGQRDNARKRAH